MITLQAASTADLGLRGATSHNLNPQTSAHPTGLVADHGRVLPADEHPDVRHKETYAAGSSETIRRRLADSSGHRLVKIFIKGRDPRRPIPGRLPRAHRPVVGLGIATQLVTTPSAVLGLAAALIAVAAAVSRRLTSQQS